MYANDDKRKMSANDDSEVAQTDARLPRDLAEIQAAIDDLKAFQATHTLDGLSIRDLIEEGRQRCQRS